MPVELTTLVKSLSARRAWIEILTRKTFAYVSYVALRKESVDRNYKERPGQKARPKSLSARRAWIEIIDYIIDYVNDAVALRKESVDRNQQLVDTSKDIIKVALRKESVDRNAQWSGRHQAFFLSLSARRAWIEITHQ